MTAAEFEDLPGPELLAVIQRCERRLVWNSSGNRFAIAMKRWQVERRQEDS